MTQRHPEGDRRSRLKTEGRPARNGPALTSSVVVNDPRSIPRPALAGRIDGVLVVVVTDPQGQARRRTYLTLAAAERATARARARGSAVTVVLARLLAVEDVTVELESKGWWIA